MSLQNIPQDSVTVTLSTEEFVTSDTVKVIVAVNLVQLEKGANARAEILTALRKLIDAEWRFSSLTRTEDTGMERVQAIAYVRVPEKDVSNVTVRVKEGKRTGLDLTIQNVDYAPPKKQIEETLAKLRNQIYMLAEQEVGKLNAAIKSDETGGHKWRVGNVTFVDTASGNANVRAMNMVANSYSVGAAAGAGAGASDDEDAGLDVTRRVMSVAKVTFSRLAWVPLTK